MNRKSIKDRLDRAIETSMARRRNFINVALVLGVLLVGVITAAPSVAAVAADADLVDISVASTPLLGAASLVGATIVRDEVENSPEANGDTPPAPEANGDTPPAPEANGDAPPNPEANGDSPGIFAMARQFLGLGAPEASGDAPPADGPSIEDLQGQISTLQAENADLKTKVAEGEALALQLVEMEKEKKTTSQAAASIAAANHTPAPDTPEAAGTDDPVGAEGISAELSDLSKQGGPLASAYIRKNEAAIRDAARLEMLASRN